MSRILITGINGSGASYLAEYIHNNQLGELHGISRWHSSVKSNLTVPAEIHNCDLNDLSSVIRVLRVAEPDIIFHIASHANVRDSFDNPIAVINNNVNSTLNLFEGCNIACPAARILLCSSSEVYGDATGLIDENYPIKPLSPYAASKAMQDHLGYIYYKTCGLQIIRTRMFSYINPRREDLFATSFAMQVAKIEAGLQNELLHGNLESNRTMIDWRDMASAYWSAVTDCVAGEVYNIGGSFDVSIGQFLDILKAKARFKIVSRVDERLLRPTDIKHQRPNVSKFRTATLWESKIKFADSVDSLLNICRDRVAKANALQMVTS